MCKEWPHPKPCLNFKCPHNLFWEGLRLSPHNIHFTKKALDIGNCCCFIQKGWTIEEIAETWGLEKNRVKESEILAWKKLKRRIHSQLRKVRGLEAYIKV